MERVLALLISAVLVVDLAVVAARAGDSPASPASELPPGATAVTGAITNLVASAEDAAPLSTPVILEVPEPGAGGATIQGAIVDGARTTIVWGGGGALELHGPGGALIPAPLDVMVDPERVVWYLDRKPDRDGHRLRPGRYEVIGPVALAQGSLGVPRDSVVFDADGETVLATSGGAYTRRAPGTLSLGGPGLVHATGSFTMRGAGGEGRATEIRFGPGAFELQLAPPPEAWHLDAILDGPLEVG